MRNPSGEKEHKGRSAQIVRLKGQRIGMKEVANVIKRHDNHRRAPKGVERRHATLDGRRQNIPMLERPMRGLSLDFDEQRETVDQRPARH